MAKTISNLDKSLKQTITPADIGAAASSHGTHVTYSTAAPLVAGTAAAGSANNVSRGDHVHPAQTSVSGNAGTATKLATARTIQIGNKSNTFDGSANITYTVADIGAAATSHTHNQINSRGNVTCESGVAARPAVSGLSMSQVYNNGYPTTSFKTNLDVQIYDKLGEYEQYTRLIFNNLAQYSITNFKS